MYPLLTLWPELPIMNLTLQDLKLSLHSSTLSSNGRRMYVIGPEQATGELHEKGIWMLMVLTPALTSSLPALTYGSIECAKICWLRKRNRGPGLQKFGAICRHHLKAELQHHTPFWGTSLKDGGERKLFRWTEFWVVHLVIRFAQKEKWLNVRLNTDSWAVGEDLTG